MIARLLGAAGKKANNPMPTQRIAKPIPPNKPGGYLSDKRPEIGADTATKAGQAVIMKPVFIGFQCKTFSKKKGNDTNAKPCVAKAAIAVMVDSANIGRRNKSTGSIGALLPASRRNKVIKLTMVSASAGSTTDIG